MALLHQVFATLSVALVSTSASAAISIPALAGGGYGGLGHDNSLVLQHPRAGYGAGYARDAASPNAAVQALIGRIGLDASDFTLEALPAAAVAGNGSLGTMQLASAGGKVVLRGSSGGALSSALNWYLNDWCNTTYDWNTYSTMTVPKQLPLPPAAGTPLRKRTVKYGYYMNVCTMGYSLVFTDWAYWERHIDWMALNGINLPLAFVGQEQIWADVFTSSYGLTFADMDAFFTGPAFLPWYRMGNIRGWAGGDGGLTAASQSFTKARGALQKKLLARMRGLGMTAVLSAFSGHVPKAFVDKHPEAKVRRSPNWGKMPTDYNTAKIHHANYASVYMLDPHDALFEEVGNKFIKKMGEEWGTDHIYQTDTYNEMDPENTTAAFLNASSSAVYGGMNGADPDAIWLMQAWLFHHTSTWGDAQIEAYVGGVAKDKLWLLDLSTSSRPVWTYTKSFYGHPYIWCTLSTFGGQNGLYGPDVGTSVLGGVYDGLNDADSTMNGVGITMEGIWTNYAVFESTLLAGWEGGDFKGCKQGGNKADCVASASAYWERFGARRYGQQTKGGVAAWKLLGDTIFGAGRGGGRLGPIEYVPVLKPKGEELPVTLRLHPELLDDERTAQEYTWHLPAEARQRLFAEAVVGASTNSMNSSADCGAASYDALPGYLFGIAKGAPPKGWKTCGDCVPGGPDPGFKKAIAWCCKAGAQCAGLTKSKAGLGFTVSARANSKVCASGTGETSYRKKGVKPSGPCHAPPPASTSAVPVNAWALLLREKTKLAKVPAYRYDLIDFARQALEENCSVAISSFKNAALAKDLPNATAAAKFYLEMIDDYDALLNTDTNFMLGPWIAWARSWSNDTKQQDWLEFNARNQITLWGPTGQINDYAAKSWGGLVSSYYKPRHELFTKMVLASLQPGAKPFAQGDYAAAWMAQIGLPWSNATDAMPVQPVGDTVAVASKLYAKYIGVL